MIFCEEEANFAPYGIIKNTIWGLSDTTGLYWRESSSNYKQGIQ